MNAHERLPAEIPEACRVTQKAGDDPGPCAQ